MVTMKSVPAPLVLPIPHLKSTHSLQYSGYHDLDSSTLSSLTEIQIYPFDFHRPADTAKSPRLPLSVGEPLVGADMDNTVRRYLSKEQESSEDWIVSFTDPSPPYQLVGDNEGKLPCHNNSLLLLTLDNITFFNCSNSTFEDDCMYKHPLLGALLSLFAVITVVGNILVIAAVGRERYLRTVTNYFVVSLAIADLIIGALVMPFGILLEVTNQVWLFGSDWCDVWHSFDVLASTASILNLSVIALDRYWAITDPIAYPRKMSTARAFILIALVWICSAAISFPAILWWRSVTPGDMPPETCAFTDDTGYLIFSSIVSFYCPIFIILFAYYKIYVAATEQIRSLKVGSKVMSANGENGEVMTLRMHRGGGRRFEDEPIHYSRAANSDSETDSPQHLVKPRCEDDIKPSRMISRKWKHFALSRKLSKIAKEQKAAKTLGIVMGVFCICWVPFFVTNVLFGICHVDCVHHAEILFPIFTWLGYINSGMNPIIYALSMRDFRRAFTKILLCCCPRYRLLYYARARRKHFDSALSSTNFTLTCGERISNAKLWHMGCCGNSSQYLWVLHAT